MPTRVRASGATQTAPHKFSDILQDVVSCSKQDRESGAKSGGDKSYRGASRFLCQGYRPAFLLEAPMGYFSNGTEGMAYQARYCDRCIHGPNKQKELCPVWWAHLEHNTAKENEVSTVLDILIPQHENNLENKQCSMFLEAP